MPPAPGGATLASHLAMIGVAVSLTLGRCGHGGTTYHMDSTTELHPLVEGHLMDARVQGE